jgi:acyl carrier protein
MDAVEIERRLFETIDEVQRLSGCAPLEITANTCPICDLDGFDSLRAVEVTILLATKLHCHFRAPKGEVNVFVSKDGRRALRVAEVINRLAELCE